MGSCFWAIARPVWQCQEAKHRLFPNTEQVEEVEDDMLGSPASMKASPSCTQTEVSNVSAWLSVCLPVCLHASTPPASSWAGLADSHVLHMVFVSCFFYCLRMHKGYIQSSMHACASILTAFFPYFCLYLHFICANYTYSIAASVSAAVVVAISTSIHVYIYIFTYLHLYLCLSPSTSICVSMSVSTSVIAYIAMACDITVGILHLCLYLYQCLRQCYVYIQKHVYIYVYIHIHVFVDVCVRAYVIYLHTSDAERGTGAGARNSTLSRMGSPKPRRANVGCERSLPALPGRARASFGEAIGHGFEE